MTFSGYALFVLVLFLVACNGKAQTKQSATTNVVKVAQVQKVDTTRKIWIDKLAGRHYSLPDSIDGKPMSFYLNNPKVATIAKAFFTGKFRPQDNDSTTQLLSYVTTQDRMVRPFYWWCLDFVIRISDGALGEYPGMPALQYATKFPNEFFSYMDEDYSGQRYKEWTEIIAYSGLNNYNEESSFLENQIKKQMLLNCKPCNGSMKNRIHRFVKDIVEAVKLQD